MIKSIVEGLRQNDLEDLILPLLSIDEFESKIGSDDEVIVVGFYAQDKNPANDLSRFLDRSTEELLDSDVSPAPTEAGYFMVFVELYRDSEFPQILMNLVHEAESLTGKQEWKFKSGKDENIHDLSEENLERYVAIEPEETEEQDRIREFLDLAYLDNVEFVGDKIVVESFKTKRIFTIVTCSDKEAIRIYESTDMNKVSQLNAIVRLFGNGYDCSLTEDENYVIHRENSEFYLILKD